MDWRWRCSGVEVCLDWESMMSKRSELRIMRVEGMESSVGVWLPDTAVVERSIAVARARVRSIIVVVIVAVWIYYRFEVMILLSIKGAVH
mmetsp:Transcript_22692/g.33738  ORF Transcript_22692/g.33738 Transcript_22692/m.33738 type:complete len:90 (+) Transcript_22692:645-914(+)